MRITLPEMVEEQSLEQMKAAQERRQASEEDDAEADLDELIRGWADIKPERLRQGGPVRGDEFVCALCHLVMHRSLMGDADRELCVECAV